MAEITNFNIRVYGLIINEKEQILISTERYKEHVLQKFVGGGLKKGEGTKQCLKREFLEELGIEIEIGNLFYINDFLQVSYFNPRDQIISIYYNVKPNDWQQLENVVATKNRTQVLNWYDISSIDVEMLTLPMTGS